LTASFTLINFELLEILIKVDKGFCLQHLANYQSLLSGPTSKLELFGGQRRNSLLGTPCLLFELTRPHDLGKPLYKLSFANSHPELIRAQDKLQMGYIYYIALFYSFCSAYSFTCILQDTKACCLQHKKARTTISTFVQNLQVIIKTFPKVFQTNLIEYWAMQELHFVTSKLKSKKLHKI
jgi:hypothetical protein